MSELRASSIDDVESFVKFLHELRNLFGRILEIVVNRYYHVEARGPNPAQQCIVLAAVSHQIDAADPTMRLQQFADPGPALVPSAVVHQDHLDAPALRPQ